MFVEQPLALPASAKKGGLNYLNKWSQYSDGSNCLTYSTSIIVLPGRAMFPTLPSVLVWQLRLYCLVLPTVDEAMRVRIDPIENSIIASLGNTRHSQNCDKAIP